MKLTEVITLKMHLDQLEHLEAEVRDVEARADQQPFRKPPNS